MPYKHLSFVDVFNSKDNDGLDLLVEIPRMQRDYAYGRVSEREKREAFLKKIKSYLCSKDLNHELDFVYGTVDRSKRRINRDCLIILDGQQRMTTLFLLHWYLARICEKYDSFSDLMLDEKNSKFTYSTRDSSAAFCNSLVLYGNSGNLKYIKEDNKEDNTDSRQKKNEPLSKRIIDEKWFFNHWNSDPTVFNMLIMIDAIADCFKPGECDDFYDKLNKHSEKSCITFNFLPFEEYGLTDELYIKMNSRGKPLTRFENLKSKILKEYDNLKETSVYRAKLSKIRTNPEYCRIESLRDYVSLMFDTKWTDVFWNLWLENKKKDDTKPCVDEMMLSYICNYCITNEILRIAKNSYSIIRNSDEHTEIEELMGYKNNVPYEYLILMLIVDKKNPRLLKSFTDIQRNEIYAVAKTDESYDSLLFDLIDLFDLISQKNNRWELKLYLDNNLFYDEKSYFLKIAFDYSSNGRNYEEKAFFFAYYLYLSKNEKQLDSDFFMDWLRFSYNIIKQSYQLVNSSFNFGTCILALNYLYDSDIYGSLINKDVSNIVTIDKYQLSEEILKAKLYRNDNWKRTIYKAEEDLSYFEGQLYYILIDYCNISEIDIANGMALENFKRVVERMHSIFDSREGCSDTMAKALTVALLSLGDYLRNKNQNFSFLKNDDRDISWRRMLKKQEDDDRNKLFGKILSFDSFDNTDPKRSLLSLGKSNVDAINEKWRKVIVENPNVLDVLGGDRFVRWNSQNGTHENSDTNWDNWEIDLLALQRMSGRHYELFSYALYLKIQNNSYPPFALSYCDVSTDRIQPCIKLEGLSVGEESFVMQILYSDNDCFSFQFEAKDEGGIKNEEVILCLEKNGFEAKEEKYIKTTTTEKVHEEIKTISGELASIQ